MSTPDPERITERLKLLDDAGWRAALTIFTAPLFTRNALIWDWIDLDTRSIYIEDLLWEYGVLSGGEQRMVRLALSLFTTGQDVNLFEVFAGIDDDLTRIAQDAILNFGIPEARGIRASNLTAIMKALQEKPVRKLRKSTRPAEPQR